MPPTDPGHSGPRRTKRVLRPILLLLLFSYGMLLVWMDQVNIDRRPRMRNLHAARGTVTCAWRGDHAA